jgi:hypothetical protein
MNVRLRDAEGRRARSTSRKTFSPSSGPAATSSFAYHRGSVAFHDDYARDLDLRQLGFTVLRFTDCQIKEEPARIVADLARALGTGAAGS